MKEYLINNKQFRLNTFDHIRDSKDAYLIGYLCGDGSYSARTKKKRAKISICSSDKEIIEWIHKNYCPDSKMSSLIPVNKVRNIISTKPSYRLPLSSEFSETFEFYKILSKKKDRNLVNIPLKYMKYYILGLFDSDGHCSWGRRKDRNRLWCNIGITHQSINVLSKVQEFLTIHLNISSALKQRKDEDCLDLKFSNRDSIIRFINWLYSEDGIFCMNRKKIHCLNFKKEYTTSAS